MRQMDIDALIREIAAGFAKNTGHAWERQVERTLDFTAIRASISQRCECIERYPQRDRALLLSWMADKRPIHSVWEWNGVSPAELVTAYQPDDAAHKAEWTRGYRVRVKRL